MQSARRDRGQPSRKLEAAPGLGRRGGALLASDMVWRKVARVRADRGEPPLLWRRENGGMTQSRIDAGRQAEAAPAGAAASRVRRLALAALLAVVAAAGIAHPHGAAARDLGVGAHSEAQRPDRSRPQSFELAFLRDPKVRPLFLPLAERLSHRIEADGAFRANARGGKLLIQRQRTAYDVVAGGVMAPGAEGAEMLDRGLAALEWGFARAGADGSFPDQAGGGAASPVLPKAFFLSAAGTSLLLVRDADVGRPFKQRGEALLPALGRSATWLAKSKGLAEVLAREESNTNQLLVAGSALQAAGVLLENAALTKRAEEVVAEALRRQGADGVFPERRGFDTNYQSVSVYYLSRYAGLLPPSAWRERVVASIRRGADTLMSAIDPRTGRVDGSRNTRTTACGPDTPNRRRSRSDGLALRLYYVSLFLNQQRIAETADRVKNVGQNFTHIEKCAANDNEPQ